MTEIEMHAGNCYYYDNDKLKSLLEKDEQGHRALVGGLWDEIGTLQFDFLVKCGLSKSDYMIDVGCGSFRGGVKFIDYLDPGHYYGIDISADLLEAGYAREIAPTGLVKRFPRTNFAATGDFRIDRFGQKFDVALAQSVFTHLPTSYLKQCLRRIRRSMKPGGRFFVTYFECPPWADFNGPVVQEPGGRTTHAAKDPFHYRIEDLIEAAGRGWAIEWLGDWSHPRNQKIAVFRRR